MKDLKLYLFFIFLMAVAGLFAGEGQAQPDGANLVKPLSLLFSHKVHGDGFSKMKISCTECHSFSVKSPDSTPLGIPVEKGFIAPSRKTCHQCHLGTVSLPRPNQCVLCHKNTEQLMPASHKQNWRFRHGQFAEVDMDSCKQCHTDRSCTQCHTQRDSMKPTVHRPNFRITHSIEARANPQSCVICHSSTTSCIQCHTQGLQ